ncbi:MAG: ABC transporter permease subunit [Clostridiales bacterium]|nr:ABC transporter permease subunit [Clostridiales bacterium]
MSAQAEKTSAPRPQRRTKISKSSVKRQLCLHSMMLPATVLLVVFSVLPMLGIWMAFSKYQPVQNEGYFSALFKGEFVGFAFFRQIFARPDFRRVLFNTVYISLIKITLLIVCGVALALLLSEVKFLRLKKCIQVIVFIPYFLSWVILSSIFIDLLSMDGPINALIKGLTGGTVSFLSDNGWFPVVIFVTELWKNLGYQAIYFLAAITSVDLGMYEAAKIDGANRWQQCFRITLPCISPIIILMVILNLGNILSAGFEQIYSLYNELVYKSGDILDTMAYRIGLVNPSTWQYSLSTAISLFKSVISCVLFGAGYFIAAKKMNYKVL